VKQTRTVANKRESAAYTFGYNHALFAQRTHDVLTILKFLRTAKVEGHPQPSFVAISAFGEAGPIVLAARALAGDAIDAVAVDTGGFRFAKLLDLRDPQFLPGGAKYFDVPGLAALGTSKQLWLAGEGTGSDVSGVLKTLGGSSPPKYFTADSLNAEAAAADWLLGLSTGREN
jgi:hypothetical protein